MESRDGWGLAQIRKVIADRGRLAPIARLLGAKVLKISFLAPVTQGPMVGEGYVVKKGRSTVFLEVTLHDLHGTEHARASSIGAPSA